MTTRQELEDLLPDYQYIDGERIVLTVGVLATFYFWGGHKATVRSALVECVEAYETAYGSHLTWAFNADTARPVPLDKMPPLRQLVRNMDEDDQVEWFAASGDIDTATDYRIRAITERGWQSDQISMVSFALPRDHAYVPEKREKLFELVRLFADKLSPFHGHLGLGAISVHQQYRYQSDEIDVATRYRGLYIESVSDANWAHTGLMSIDWITFIGATLAERVGGIKELEPRLTAAGGDIQIASKGLFVSTGNEPDIGPVGEKTASSISALNAALRPLRIGNVESMGYGSINGELRFTRYTSDLWVRRYDGTGIWPPTSFIGLPQRPPLQAPTRKITLKTGSPCVIAGRYRYLATQEPEMDEDYIQQIVLLPGDISPYWIKLGPHGEYLGRDSVEWELLSAL